MAFKRLTLTRGQDVTYSCAFTNSNGTPYHLKNCVLFFTVKQNSDLPDASASIQKIVTSFTDTTAGTASTSGSALVTLSRADTLSLDAGEYYYDFSLVTAAGKTNIVQKGQFILEPNATTSTGTAGTAA